MGSAGILFDVLLTFGSLTPEVAHYRKYAKMKAAYIHNCLKNGETPIAGPLADDEEDDNGEDDNKEGGTPHEEDQEYIPSVPYNPPSAPTQAPAADMASMTISSPSPSSDTASLSYDK